MASLVSSLFKPYIPLLIMAMHQFHQLHRVCAKDFRYCMWKSSEERCKRLLRFSRCLFLRNDDVNGVLFLRQC